MVLLLGLASAPCYATSHYLDSQIRLSHLQRHTETILSDAENGIAAFLTESERKIQDQAAIRVPANYALIAHASPDAIVISSGTLWILEQLAMAHLADRALGYSGCEEDYTSYIANGLTQHSQTGEVIQYRFTQIPLKSFAAELGDSCVGFHPIEIRAHGLEGRILQLLKASMMLIYLHELGHHILGHVAQKPTDALFSRRLEAAADAWAIEAAYRSGVNVLDGTPALNLIAAMGADSPAAENIQSHPSGPRRVRDMMHRALEILTSAGKDEIVTWLNKSLEISERKHFTR